MLLQRVGNVLTFFQRSQLEAACVYKGCILVVATRGSMTRGHHGHLVAGLGVLSVLPGMLPVSLQGIGTIILATHRR